MIGAVSGVLLMVVTVPCARYLLILTNCQPDVLEMVTVCMRIYFLGMPIIMLYNFVAAILRAIGDSVRPMIYMLVAGVLNIALILALTALIRSKGICKTERKNLRVRKNQAYGYGK